MEKILILANNAGGLYNFRFELINKLISRGYEVYFAVPQSMDNNDVKLIIESGAKHIQTSMNRRGKNPIEELKLIKKYKKIVKEINPNIILTYTVKPNIYGNYVANKFNKPVIMNITGIGSSLATGKLKYIIKKMYKYACSKANVAFFQNEGNRDFFIENNMITKTKTKLIPGSGVNIEKFKSMGKTKKDDIIRFLFIGRIMKEKGIEEYLKVAEKLTNKYSNVEFQLLGSFEEDEYKDIISNNKNKRIKYLGISNDVRNEIREVDCIVNPSYHEGMSNVLLEGAAMGKPLIASNIPGCKEIIDEGFNGYLFEVKSVKFLEEKLVQFINLGNEIRESMGKNSRKKVQKEFDRNIVINEYMKAINNILKEGCQDESI